MDARRARPPVAPVLALALVACGPVVATETDTAGSSSDDTSTGSPATTTGPVVTTVDPTTSGDPTTSTGSTGTTAADSTSEESTGLPDLPPPCEPDTPGCGPRVDLLLVLDNSGAMGHEQLRLTRSLPYLVERLEGLTDLGGTPLQPDVQVMVTTTDFGNPLCTPFEPAGYEPARGAPVATACTSRLQDFTDLTGTVSLPEACETHCPQPLEPALPFITFNSLGDNVPDVPPADIDGDGDDDSAVAQTLACLAPQGINGCGYEAPLENTLQALNPAAPWNEGLTPFLRPDATLAIAILTDEADCSVQDYSMMNDESLMNVNPSSGSPAPSSAMCWNAGMDCDGPDAMGVFSSCVPQVSDLQEVSRYTNYLVGELRESQGKEVVMLGIVGVPTVVEHDADPPYQPTAGGAFDLVYRDWIDFPYPAGDILPDEWNAGVTAADKQFELGIGPGCTGFDSMGDFVSQAIPPGRILEVCQALDYVDEASGEPRYRCCLESICDEDHTAAIDCFMGLVQDAVTTAG
jgi:hypothetical protein